MDQLNSRREFLKQMGLGAALIPFIANLPSAPPAGERKRKQRLVVIFTPNGVNKSTFWPDQEGKGYALKESMAPLEKFRDRMLIMKGVSTRVRGDGDNHMRGIGCLLTGAELFPGNIQGGSDTPAGWASGLSIDQEIKAFLQASDETRTRFGSLEFGVMVPDHADTWTRMVYSGPNKPVAPIDDPYQMFNRLYGSRKDMELLGSVLDDLTEDMARVKRLLSPQDRAMLEEHASLVRDMEKEMAADSRKDVGHAVPALDPGVRQQNDRIPAISKLQIDLMVSSFLADSTRIATLQYTNSVGQARFTWLGINEGHHDLSHEPNSNGEAQAKLTKINHWFAGQIAYLCDRLSTTKDPDGHGSLLDNTTILWTNELGEGNSHTLENIPFVLIGGGMGFDMGRYVDYKGVPHNRLLMAMAHGFGHRISRFGNPDLCANGPLSLSA